MKITNPTKNGEIDMTISKSKVCSLASFGGALIFLSMSATAGWYAGSCADHFANGGCGACLDYTDTEGQKWHINGPGSSHTSSGFKGAFPPPPPAQGPYGTYASGATANFIFRGETDLACGIGLECDLVLEGTVKKDSATSTVNIEVSDGYAEGGGLCSLVVIDSFPWYIGTNAQTSGWSASGGLPIMNTGPYIGTVGEIGFRINNPLSPSLPPIVSVSDAYVKDVTFSNNGSAPSCFTFASDFYDSGTTNSTGCSISGELCIEGGHDVNIEYQACI